MDNSDGRLKIGIYELTGCAGDALLILDCEEELLDIFKAVNIQSFLMAKSDNIDGDLDVALIEGSVSTEKEIEELKDIRKRSKIVVAFGLCATVGGIQARFNDKEWEDNLKKVYGDVEMTHVSAVRSKPIDDYIDVDFYLPGCPVGKEQFLNFFTRAVGGSSVEKYPQPVCVTCKYKENDCLLVKGIPCLGPLTADGCGAVCPSYNVPCYGCWGIAEGANFTSEFYLLQEKGFDVESIKKRMSNYSGTKLKEFFDQFKKEKK
jgi:sulfhydrogenase subunit delta